MATTTQNLGLIKPAGTDKIRIAQINSNMDTIDTKMGPVGNTPLQTQATNAASSISALQSGMAIICNNNTHAAIASGQYAYVRNHSSLAEGLYQATAAIAANATLSTSNLAAVPGGGLNSLNDKVTTTSFNITRDEQNTIRALYIGRKAGNCCVISIDCVTNAKAGWVTIGTSSEKPDINIYGTIVNTSGNSTLLAISAVGYIQIYSPASSNYIGQITFFV